MSNKNNKKQEFKHNADTLFKKVVEFINTNKRYVIAAGALLCFVLILFFAVGKGGLFIGKKSSSGDALKFVENKDKEITTLFENYYEAYAAGDVKALASYAAPISDNECEYIELFSSYIKAYKIDKIYTQQGIDENSCLAMVEIDIEFEGVKTTAPGLDCFYITGIRTGHLYINNLYSQFNLGTHEYVTEDQINTCIKKFVMRSEVAELQEKVDKRYEEAILKDEDLDFLINSTMSVAINDLMSSLKLLQNQMPPVVVIGDSTDDDSGDDSDDAGEGEDEPEPEEIVIDPELEITEYAITTDEVNVRFGASKDKKAIGKAAAGAKVIVIAVDPWGEWSYVQVNDDLKGFIRNDFLITQDNDEAITGLPGYPEKDAKATIVTDGAELVTSMKEYNRTIITKLTEGTQVTVITAYRNGFVKVMVNGKTGYILLTTITY